MGVIIRGTRNILRNPLRSILVVILLGGNLTTAALTAALTTSTTAASEYVKNHVGTEVVVEQSGLPLTNEIISQAEKTPGVTHAEERVVLPSTQAPGEPLHLPEPPAPSGGNDGTNYYVWLGLVPDAPLIGRLGVPGGILEGRMFSHLEGDADVAIMSGTMAQANHLLVGSTFLCNGTRLTLIGTYTTHTFIGDLSVVLPLHTAQRVLQTNSTQVIVYALDNNHVSLLMQALRQRLGDQIDITGHKDEYTATLAALSSTRQVSVSISIASILVALLVISFTVLMTVRERVREIGILKCIGASHGQIVTQLCVEVGDLCLLAAVIAIGVLFIFSPLIASIPARASLQGEASLLLAGLSVDMLPIAIMLVLAGGITLALLVSIPFVLLIIRLKPADILRVD